MTVAATDYNGLIAYYNSALGIGMASVAIGQPIAASNWSYMLSTVNSIAAAQGRTWPGPMPDASIYVIGHRIQYQVWQAVGSGPAPAVFNFTSNGSFVVPAGIFNIHVTEAAAGGGGGGGGLEASNGSAGGGGGGGAFVGGLTYGVTPGQTVTVGIGSGGAGGYGYDSGSPGGSTTVFIDSSQVVSLPGGGGGGAGSTGFTNNSGGTGGSPSGGNGATGFAGAGDGASGSGGTGGSNPIGAGGTGGGAGQAGSPGNSWGGGGGGAGFRDRASPLFWRGGDGASGFCQITYP